MDIQHYRQAGKPFQYIAARMGGPFDPLPHWFQRLEKTGILRYDSEHNVEVRIITGAWVQVEQGDWVVLQRASTDAGVGFSKPAIWHVTDEVFNNLWSKV